MGTTTAAGTTLAISAAAPATPDVTGYAALSYTTIGSVEKLGTIGAAYDKVEFQPLNGPKQKFKGPVDYGQLQPSMAYDPTDAGQTLFRAAAFSNNNYSFKVIYPDGGVRYFQGRAFGYPENIDGAGSIVMANPTVEINTSVIVVNPT